MSTLQNLSLKQLKRAVEIREQLEVLEAELTLLLSVDTSPSPGSTAARPVKKTMSAAGRANLAAGMKERWAKIRATKGKAA